MWPGEPFLEPNPEMTGTLGRGRPMTGPHIMTDFSCGGESANASARDSVEEVVGFVKPQPNLNAGVDFVDSASAGLRLC